MNADNFIVDTAIARAFLSPKEETSKLICCSEKMANDKKKARLAFY